MDRNASARAKAATLATGAPAAQRDASAALALKREIVQVDAVGGTAILIRGNAHRNGLIFPSFVTENKMETEGLVAIAKRMGYRAYAMPRVMTRHNR
jgi:hypothetical protein